MKKFLAFISMAFLAVNVAYAAPDLTGKSEIPAAGANQGGETSLEIKQVSPGVADFTFKVNSGIVLNEEPDGKVYSEKDKSDKGIVYVVPGSKYNGAKFGLAGVGPAWPGRGSGKDTQFDLNRMYVAAMSGESVTVRIQIPQNSYGTVFAVVPVITDSNGHLIAWGSHPAGPTRYTLTRRDGTKDMLTILTVTQDGNIRPASQDEVKKYHDNYQSYF